MRIIFTILVSLFFSTSLFSQNYKQVKIFIDDLSDVTQLELRGLEFDHPYLNKDNSVTVFLSDQEMNILQSSGFSYEILIDDWYDHYNNLPKLTEQEKREFVNQSIQDFNVSGFGFGSMGGFYTLVEVIAELDSMKQLYPDLITTKASIGTTVEGRNVYMVKISDNPQITENEPEVLFTALHHAREPQGMMSLIYYMYYLLENYGIDPEVTYLVNNREIYFIPVVNPDGYEYNRQNYPNGGGMWRKNRRNNGGSYGVDLNRNYGPMAYWNAPNGGSSTIPSSETYRGPSPFSEPETQNTRDFLSSHNIKNALNYHTYGDLLIYPYGALEMETPDSLIFREFASDMTHFNGYTYGTDQQTVGYSTRGNSDDYFYDGDTVANSGKIFAMTPEVGNFSDGFWPTQSRIFPLAIENLFPNLYYTWVAGDYVSVYDAGYSEDYIDPGDDINMFTVFKNKGLSDVNGVEASLNSLSPHLTITNSNVTLGIIPARDTYTLTTPFSFSVSQNALVDELASLVVTVTKNSTVMSKDTLSFILGTPIFIFKDTVNNPLINWTVTATPSNPKWEATTESFYSSPNSYTDSKNTNYTNSATVTMTLTDPIDLSLYQNPRLSFWTKFEIESNWDYGQVEISTNNGSSWTPLEGDYTEPGTGSFQPSGQPVYDGSQSSWVNETISLSSFTSSQTKVRFELRTDGSVTRDGWYVDDIGILIYGLVPVELTSFSAVTDNNNVLLKWKTASELNNSGFEIQKTTSGKNSSQRKWNKIGFINGHGTTTETRSYSFNDPDPVEGKSYYRLKQVDYDGSFTFSDEVMVDLKGVYDFALDQNYPNPFNPSTKIVYSIPEASNVSLKVYNILGAEVATLMSGYQQAGKYEVDFSTNDESVIIGSGVYVYTLQAGEKRQSRKMVILK